MKSTALYFTLSFLWIATVSATPLAGSKPNIILVITDDQGMGDLSCMGNKIVQTPNIDRFFKKSTRFRDFQVSPTCAPTRAAIMSGRPPFKVGVTHTIYQRERMTLDVFTLPQALQSAGYATGLFGKWHLGDEDAYLPQSRGFDEVLMHGAGGIGQARYGDFPPNTENLYFDNVLLHNNTIVQTKGYCTDVFFESALAWIRKQADTENPYFAYVSLNAPHAPMVAPESYTKRFIDLGYDKGTAGRYGMVENIDHNVGEMMRKLEEWKALEDTLVIFMTDNGATHLSGRLNGKKIRHYNANLKGAKNSPYEGGTHVPAFWQWRGKLGEGVDIDGLTAHLDLYPTFCELAGVSLPETMQDLDGRSLLPLLKNSDAKWPDRELFIHCGRWDPGKRETFMFKKCAVRTEEWRLVNNEVLYHIETDPSETKDVAASHPDVVAKLQTSYKKWWDSTLPFLVNENLPRVSPEEQPLAIRYEKQLAEKGIPAWAPEAAEKPPNFIIIFTDDQGYQDLGCYGSPDIATPNLDRMAAEGMRFTSFYAQTICGPSRTALMTSSYPLRVAQVKNRCETHPVVHAKEITIAEVLKSKGYTSAAFGKWDLATHSQSTWIPGLLPRGQGFDYFFGTPTSNDRVVHLLRNEEVIERNADMAMLTKRYTDEAIQFIENNKDDSFFVYLAHTMPHTRLDASKEFKGKSKAGLYGDVIEEIDHNAGRILQTVKDLGLDDNTYVIFTSDNGPWILRKDHGGHALPLRSGKTTCWEGGMRVPCIIRAPGRIPAGLTNDQLTATIDVLPTLAAIAGADVTKDRTLDGLDISNLWHGEPAELDRPYFYYQHFYLRAVRKGDWKVMLKHEEGPKSATAKWKSHVDAKDAKPLTAHQLYNLKDDIGETTNLAAKHPDKLAELLELADWARGDIGDYNRIGTNARFFDEGPNRLTRKPAKPPVKKKRQE